MIKKICTKCDKVKNSSEFNKDASKPDEKTSWCKSCLKIARDSYRNEDREHFNEINRNSLRRRRKEVYPLRDITLTEKFCGQCRTTQSVDNFVKVPTSSTGLDSWCVDCRRFYGFEYLLRTKYNITYAEYAQMHSDQDAKCLICKKEVKLVVDHDHETGRIRGLLCSNCNTGIGMLQDSEEILLSAIDYLRRD